MPARDFQRSSRVEGRALGTPVKRMDAYARLLRKNLYAGQAATPIGELDYGAWGRFQHVQRELVIPNDLLRLYLRLGANTDMGTP